MAKRVTTLFISDDAINLLVVEGRRVKQWASLPLEAGLVSQGLIMDEAKVADELDKLFKVAKIGSRRVVAGISGLNSLYRLISLPELPDAVVPEAIKQEAKRVIPLPLEEVYLSYQRLPASLGETRVFLAAFPRNVADALYRTLHQAGIQPYIMDLAPLALCRTLNEPRAIIVNARLDNIDIVVMSERLPQPIRTLSLPGEAASLSERLPTISEEIDRTVAFYNSSHKEEPLDSTVPMFVSGDLVQVPESWQSLAGKLKCPVAIAPSPVESPDGFNPSDFMVNIGLALRELATAKERANFSLVNFNALPEVYLPKGVRLTNIVAPLAVAVGVGLLVYMGFMVRGKVEATATLRSQLPPVESLVTQQHKEIAPLQEQIKQAEDQAKQLEAQVQPVETRATSFDTTFTSLGVSRYRLSDELSEIVKLLQHQRGTISGTMYLTTVHDEGDLITISGRAPSEGDIFVYAKNLAIRFGDVIVSSIKLVEDDLGEIVGYDFNLLVK
jgi:type IV pilus assembly protein PilM